ncbi:MULTISPECIES: radical SAM/SPASM domain-containing protein [unclassified Novosphingobium]|uniref:radical SAM/SPASM domain-containing protein n=1 Tax=unclassified Novosphingobium TaxID=2644732 RepID=UPI00135A5FBA|nr:MULTISPECIES: radical SAM/SPASM domain-containing protein [unclassified Novosphingobium]
MVKIDVSPLCALACPTCLHADPAGRNRPLLDAQNFSSLDRIDIAKFAEIIEELKGRALAVSLSYYGDPLMHPAISELSRIAANTGVAVHITTHFSYNWSDAKIQALVESGLSHLTVALDGATQDVYEVTRINGRVDFVINNLRRVIEIRNRLGRSIPKVEVQHIRHPHHDKTERERVRAIADDAGVDHFITFKGVRYDRDGDLYNVVDSDAGGARSGTALKSSALPRCHWPFSSTVIKVTGDVIPCCMWREGQQYIDNGDTRSLGNVFDQPLSEIWNSPSYQALRKEVSNPSRHGKIGSFCEGCSYLYESTPRVGEFNEHGELVEAWTAQ